MASEELPVCVPMHFRCPISFDMMKDPVSLSTGMTYDRSSIEKWFDTGHNTCPATMQTLANQALTPNHTLRRLIQTWLIASNFRAPEAQPYSEEKLQPQPQDTKRDANFLLKRASKESTSLESLRKLRAKAKESSKNCRDLVESGAVVVLLSLLGSHSTNAEACEAIVGTLALLPVDNATKRMIGSSKNLSMLSWILSSGSLDAKINAAVLLESLAMNQELKVSAGSTEGVFKGLVELLKVENYNLQMAVKASLRTLLSLCLARRNRVLAVNAGVIAALVEVLPDVATISAEYVLAVLELLCKCAEGRAAFIGHALAIPAVAHKISHVSDAASEYAVGILWGICKHCGEESVRKYLIEAGILAKLMLFLQLDFSSHTKHNMAEFLKLLKNISKCSSKLDEA